ncbi:MAG: SIS domain-containing protein [Lachnospiraceae bacterium]|nr:SIS domain-containing protein [Lachnospiraceae bacterium]
MIELIVFDIDGVLTDGRVTVDYNGNEHKSLNMKDVDGIFELSRRGFRLAAITGEDTPIVDYFEKRFPWEFFFRGEKTKKETMQQIEKDTGIKRESICYVGDGKYDIEPLSYAGLGLCPADAVDKAKEAADMVLRNSGGNGCVWEMIEILEHYNNEESPHKYMYDRMLDHTVIFKRMVADPVISDTVVEVADKVAKLLCNHGNLFLCGNGGSAADAQHIATEFVGRFYKERPALNAEALTTNTSTITAIGNDYSFERVFVRQLEAKAHKGDFLIAISTSGRSSNIIEALKYAGENEINTLLLMGDFNLREDMPNVDYIIKVPSKVTPRIQEAHIFIGHCVAEYVEHKLYGEEQ